jgi:hypothetical protein
MNRIAPHQISPWHHSSHRHFTQQSTPNHQPPTIAAMELTKGTEITSFDQFWKSIEAWAIAKKFTPRVLKKDK